MKTYLPWILLGVIVAASGAFVYKGVVDNRNLRNALLASSQELTEAKLSIGRAETRIADASGTISKLEKQLKDEIAKRNAIVTAYGELNGQLEAEKKKVKVLTKIIYRDKPSIVDLPKGKIFVREEDGTYSEIQQLTLEYKDFRIDFQADCLNSELSYKIHQKFEGQFVETRLPTGQYNHYFNLWELDDTGKRVGKVVLDKFVVIKTDENKAKFHWFNPKLDLMLGGGVSLTWKGEWTGDVGISLASYGKTTNDISWRFLRVGVGLTGYGFSVSLSPFAYNLGDPLPLVSNLWITPFVGYDTGIGSFYFGAGVGVVF